MGALQLAAEMKNAGRHGSIVTLICDSGQRYERSYHNDAWLEENGFHIGPWAEKIRSFMSGGGWDPSLVQPSHAPANPHLAEGI
jgi:cysteine synthase A